LRRFSTLLFLALLMAVISLAPVQAQGTGFVSMNISAGYAGRFRDNTWTPVLVSLENNGTRSFTGQLIVRPERSQGVTNPVSTPVSLAPDTQQAFTLYISLRTFAETVRVELLTDEGLIAAEADASVTAVLPRERLYVRVTDGTSRPIDLSDVVSYGQNAVVADWFINNIPDRGVGLESVDLMLITNVDTGQLTPQQRQAVANWVLAGGHLIVTGGPRWQETAAGLTQLLPLQPESSELSAAVDAVANLAGVTGLMADVETVVARGTLTEDASVLAQDTAGEALVARRSYGYGVIDYVAFDPTTPPFRGWRGLPDLWFSLATSRDVRPTWSYGFLNPTQGYNAVEILPGVTALPEALAMVSFLLAYVVLIGPVNYLVLSRIGRREFAWFTIPAMIVAFTIIAWVTGFNLRGTEVVLSRLSVVESWPESETSHVRQLIGLLSPRRANYDLTLPDSRALRPLLRPAASGFFTNQASTVEIVQSDIFNAVDFPVDASFMAGFMTDGSTERALVTGTITIIDDSGASTQTWRGSIRNELSVPLTDLVLLSRAGAVYLEEPLAPGEIQIIEEELHINPLAPVSAAPIEYVTGFLTPAQTRFVSRNRSEIVGPEQTLSEIVGPENFRSALYFGMPLQTGGMDQAEQRKQTFLANFMVDQYNATARGDHVYLIGWTDAAPFTEEVTGASWRAVDTTMYITQLETNLQTAPGERARISPDQFTWTLIEDEAATNSTPNLIRYLNRGKLSYRLTPVPTSVLETVDELVVMIERGSSSLANTEVRLMNWDTGRYEVLELTGERTVIENPDAYIGPNNAVQVEIDRLLSAGALSLTRLAVEQYGTRKSG
jgi:hypothetical protein